MAYHVRVYTTDINGKKFPVDRDTYPDYPSAEMAANDIYQALTGEWPTRDMHHVVKIYDGNRLVDELIWDGEGDYDPRVGKPRVRRKSPARKKTNTKKKTAKRRY